MLSRIGVAGGRLVSVVNIASYLLRVPVGHKWSSPVRSGFVSNWQEYT